MDQLAYKHFFINKVNAISMAAGQLLQKHCQQEQRSKTSSVIEITLVSTNMNNKGEYYNIVMLVSCVFALTSG